MNTTKEDYLQQLANIDCEEILAGNTTPHRNASGERTFTSGETELIEESRPAIEEHEATIEVASKGIQIAEEGEKIIYDDFNEAMTKYEEDKGKLESEIDSLDQQLEQEKKKVEALTHTSSHTGNSPKKTGMSANAKRFLGFMLIAFVAELVAFIATIGLQREELSAGTVYSRIIYIVVIYIYTGVLFARYNQTKLSSVKALLIGCITMSVVSLLHVIALPLLSIEPTTSVASGFDLTAIETVEEVEEEGVISRILYRPGLIEFVIATLMVFAGEILTIDSQKKKSASVSPTDMSNNDLEPGNCTTARIKRCRQHMADIEAKRTQKQQELAQLSQDFSSYTDDITLKASKYEIQKKKEQETIQKHSQIINAIVAKKKRLLTCYQPMVQEELAYRLNVSVDTIEYEPVTEDDIKAQLNIV